MKFKDLFKSKEETDITLYSLFPGEIKVFGHHDLNYRLKLNAIAEILSILSQEYEEGRPAVLDFHVSEYLTAHDLYVLSIEITKNLVTNLYDYDFYDDFTKSLEIAKRVRKASNEI